MWRSVLLHEFRDRNIRSVQALPGSVIAASPALAPADGMVSVRPGRGFQYRLADPLTEVVGVSCRVRFRFPFQGTTNAARLVALQPSFELFVHGTTHGVIRVRARVGQAVVELADPFITDPAFMDLRFDWHTTGQAFLRVDNELVGYQNQYMPGGRFQVTDVAFGLLDVDPAIPTPRYDLAKVFIRALARIDTTAALSRDLPIVDVAPTDQFARCRQIILKNAMARLDDLRAFMGLVHQTLSQPWSAGDQGDPFTEPAIKAHALALTCGSEMHRMMRAQTFTDAAVFLSSFSDLLRILRDARPDQFGQLTDRLVAPLDLPNECLQLIQTARKSAPALEPLLELLDAVGASIQQIADGN